MTASTNSALVVLETYAYKSTGHHAEKCQVWLEEAVKEYASVTLVCCGPPSVAMPAGVRLLQVAPAGGWWEKISLLKRRNFYSESFRSAMAACREARHQKAPCLFLTATPLVALFAALWWRTPSSSAQVIMNLGKDGKMAWWSRWLFRQCLMRTWMCCNTVKSAEILREMDVDGSHILYSPDPMGEVVQKSIASIRILKMFVPGDDDIRRTTLSRLTSCKGGEFEGMHFSLHQPGLTDDRKSAIMTSVPGIWKFYDSFAADRTEFESRFQEADAVLICYLPSVTYGSGNLVLALMCHRPLLVSRFPAALQLAEEFGRIGEFFDEEDPSSMEAGLQKLRAWGELEWSEFNEAVARLEQKHLATTVCPKVFEKLNLTHLGATA